MAVQVPGADHNLRAGLDRGPGNLRGIAFSRTIIGTGG
jgi:hypothetical protein